MTREEAIRYGNEWLKDEYLDAKDGAFIKMAIKVFEQEPCKGVVYLTREAYGELCYEASKWNELEVCEDAISREVVLKLFATHDGKYLYEAIRELPSVQPKRKTGHWIPCTVSSGRDSWQCSECGNWVRNKSDYCLNCGAKM